MEVMNYYSETFIYRNKFEYGKTIEAIKQASEFVNKNGGIMIMVDLEVNCNPEYIKKVTNWSDSEFEQKCLYVNNVPGNTYIAKDIINLIRDVTENGEKYNEKIKPDSSKFIIINSINKTKIYPEEKILPPWYDMINLWGKFLDEIDNIISNKMVNVTIIFTK